MFASLATGELFSLYAPPLSKRESRHKLHRGREIFSQGFVHLDVTSQHSASLRRVGLPLCHAGLLHVGVSPLRTQVTSHTAINPLLFMLILTCLLLWIFASGLCFISCLLTSLICSFRCNGEECLQCHSPVTTSPTSSGPSEYWGNWGTVESFSVWASVNAFYKVFFFSSLSNHFSFSTYHLHAFTCCSSSSTYFFLSQSFSHLLSLFCPDGSLILGIIVAIFGVISVLYIVNKVVKLVRENGITSFYSCGEYSSMIVIGIDVVLFVFVYAHTCEGEKVGLHYSCFAARPEEHENLAAKFIGASVPMAVTGSSCELIAEMCILL